MKVTLTRKAQQDLFEIRDYVREQFPDKEIETINRLEHIFSSLTEFPLMGKKGRVSGTREYTIPGLPYIVIYRTQGNELQILRLFHGSRDPSSP